MRFSDDYGVYRPEDHPLDNRPSIYIGEARSIQDAIFIHKNTYSVEYMDHAQAILLGILGD